MQHLRKRLGKIDEVVVRLQLLRFQLPRDLLLRAMADAD